MCGRVDCDMSNREHYCTTMLNIYYNRNVLEERLLYIIHYSPTMTTHSFLSKWKHIALIHIYSRVTCNGTMWATQHNTITENKDFLYICRVSDSIIMPLPSIHIDVIQDRQLGDSFMSVINYISVSFSFSRVSSKYLWCTNRFKNVRDNLGHSQRESKKPLSLI